MRVGVVVHHERPEALELARTFFEKATAAGLDVVAEAVDAERLGAPSASLTDGQMDAVVAIGGDGTVLEAARIGLSVDAPILGINAGRVGFLADAEPSSIGMAVEALASESWKETEVMTITAELPDGTSELGINDVVIEKVTSQRLVSIALQADGEDVLTYHADGVIICTPTGSTAYNLSAGGPLVDRRFAALVVTPVASHALFSKSLVFAGATHLRCTVTQDRLVGVAVDGRELAQLEPGSYVDVRRGERTARLIDLSGRSFDQAIRRKFGLK